MIDQLFVEEEAPFRNVYKSDKEYESRLLMSRTLTPGRTVLMKSNNINWPTGASQVS